MTLHATREGQHITVHHNLGIGHAHSEHKVTDHAEHVRHFHTQLGQLLDEADAERAEEAREHTDAG